MTAAETTAVIVHEQSHRPFMDVVALRQQVQSIQKVMHDVMQEGQHYGKIPGCGDKPTLLQPGAQKLALTFGFAPEFEIQQTDLDGGHREYRVVCRLMHRASGGFVGQGVGACSTMESRYRYRVAPKRPTGRPVPKAYWDHKQAGNMKAALEAIGGHGYSVIKHEGQWVIAEGSGEKIEHNNPADYYNTVLKMAKKRAYVDAVITATAASDIFTQDLEDLADDEPAAPPQQQQPERQQQPQPIRQQDQPEPQQQPAGDPNVITVESVEIKEGKSKNGKPYTLYKIKAADGREFSTFDVNHYNTAVDCKQRGVQALIDFKETQWGHDLKSIDPLDSTPPQQQQSVPANAEAVEAAILKVDPPRRGMLNGQPAVVYGVDTSEGRFGAVGEHWGDDLKPYVGTGEVVRITYVTEKQGRRILSIDEVTDVGNPPDDEVPW